MHYFLSRLVGAKVLDRQGHTVGRLRDLVAHQMETQPEVLGLVIRRRMESFYLPFQEVAELGAHSVRLRGDGAAIVPAPPPEGYVFLRRDLLDAQVVDTHGVRILRVNDVLLNHLTGRLCITGLDTGVWGLIQRLGWTALFARFVRMTGIRVPSGMIGLDTVAFIEKDAARVRLAVAQDRLVRMHPADLAEIVEEMGRRQRDRLYGALSNAQLADLVEASAPAMQTAILHELTSERAVEILAAMEPDEAADLLGELPQEETQTFLGSLPDTTAADLRQLLTHSEDSAGAMMTTSFLAVSDRSTVGETLRWLRETHPEAEIGAYLYLTDPEDRLTGVVSLRRLILAGNGQQLIELSSKPLYHVHVHTPQQEAVEMIARYKLLALPVLDAAQRLAGVITIHDVLNYFRKNVS